MIAVVLDTSRGMVFYGPFADGDRLLAERFAAFLNDEIDPAWLVEIAEGLPVAWHSPVIELLNWRASVARTARKVVAIKFCRRCGENRPADHICPVSEAKLRRHLAVVTDHINPNGTTPGEAGVAYDAPVKGDAS